MFYCIIMLLFLVLYVFEKIQLQTVVIIYAASIPMVLGMIMYRINNLEVIVEEDDKEEN